MATIKESIKATPAASVKKTTKSDYTLFNKENYLWMIGGLVVMAIGFALMAGGKSSNPQVFNDNEVNSFRRITLAPILIMAGLVLEIVAIMKKPKSNG